MTGGGVVALVIWLLGTLWGARWFAREVMLSGDLAPDDWSDVLLGGLVGLVIGAIVWPLLGLFAIARRVLDPPDGAPADFAATLFGESREDKLASRELEVMLREQRIRELEREAGIADDRP